MSDNHESHQYKNLLKPFIIIFLFLIIAGAVQAFVLLGRDFLPQTTRTAGDASSIFFLTMAVVFFIRWLIVDAPFTFLRQLTVTPLLKTIISMALYFIAIVYLLHKIAGIDIKPLLTTSAVLTGIIVLSLQETIRNLFTGIWINAEKLVVVGDWVRIADKEGMVLAVTWRTTRLKTREGDILYIPNRMLAEGIVENYTHPSNLHAVEINIGASYDAPPNKVTETLLDLASRLDCILKNPEPEVWILNYGDHSISYKLRAWIDDYGMLPKIKTDLNNGIWYAFRRNNIEIPFPIRSIHRLETKKKAHSAEEIIGYIKNMDFLKALPDDAINDAAQSAKIMVYGNGEILFRQGDKGNSCFFIKKGSVDIFISEEGKEKKLSTLGAGEFFGEMSLLTGEPRTATAIANGDSEFIVIDHHGFKDIILNQPNIAEKLADILAKRTMELEETKKAISEEERTATERMQSKRLLKRISVFFGLK